MINRILTVSFYLLFISTPLLWAPWNQELFEYPKMMFVYLLTVVITAAWLIKMVKLKTLILKKSPLNIPLLLFLLANILSTIFSIDPHTSIWGYYSRSNGGLLSIISYTVLYFALISNFDKLQAIKFLKAGILGGLIVALYAIPEHFGVSPSCVILSGTFDANCWVQNVQDRVFATLGQPNWLGGYLSILIFPALYFLFTSKSRLQTTVYSLQSLLMYLALTFTYSRGAALGLLGGIVIFIAAIFINFKFQISNFKKITFILTSFLIINLIFGSALTSFKLINKFAPPPRPNLIQAGTQLESGGDETSNIRLIVWTGALDIFKYYPIIGSGVETFAYSYYQFRPTAHNLTSEWDFLYNKAHNEFLNYLATTGIVGFSSYILLIMSFVIWSIRCIMGNVLCIRGKGNNTSHNTNYLLHTTILAAYISYLVQNFFGFSVVVTALLFYLLPALAFLITDSTSNFHLPTSNFKFSLPTSHFSPLFSKFLICTIIILSALGFYTIVKFYFADISFAAAQKYSNAGKAGKAYIALSDATKANPVEPLYQSELGYIAASAAVALVSDNATSSAEFKNQALKETQQVLETHPNNVSFLRTAIRTYYLLSTIDNSLTSTTMETLDKTIKKAPTDPKLVYNKALLLEAQKNTLQAIIELKKAVSLKPNYQEALDKLKKLSQ